MKYFIFNNILACFSFDGADVSTPVVFATRRTDGHILFERLYQIEHVTAINPTDTIRIQPIPTAQPFDEFSTPDVQNDNTITKSDWDSMGKRNSCSILTNNFVYRCPSLTFYVDVKNVNLCLYVSPYKRVLVLIITEIIDRKFLFFFLLLLIKYKLVLEHLFDFE